MNTEVIESTLFDHYGMKLEINSTRKTGLSTNM